MFAGYVHGRRDFRWIARSARLGARSRSSATLKRHKPQATGNRNHFHTFPGNTACGCVSQSKARNTPAGHGRSRPLIYKFDECVYAIPRCFELIDWVFLISVAQRDTYDHIFVVRYVEEFFDVILIGIDEADGAGG
jgi:hypothetical protein